MSDLKIPFLLMIGVCALTMSACFDDSPAGPPPSPRDRYDDYYSSANRWDDGYYSSARFHRSSSSQRWKRSSSSEVESSSSRRSWKSSSSVNDLKISSSSEVLNVSSSSVAFEVSSSSVAVKESSSSVAPASSSESNENWRETCLEIINAYRATENLAPLSLAPDAKQTCTDNQAADDLAENSAHGHFGACGEGAQNTGPNVRMSSTKTYADYAQMYLKMMWEDEKALVTSGEADPAKDEDYSRIGHYLNMKGAYKTVACGFAVTENGKTGWLNINFFR